MWTGSSMVAVLVFLDFALRSSRYASYSPLVVVAKYILDFFCVHAKLSDEAPKKFARYLGLVSSFFIVLFSFSGWVKVSMIIAVILVLCAFFEAAFDYCVGCKIYHLIQMTKLKSIHKKV